MDILFRKTYTYKNDTSFEVTKDKLESIFNKKKWYDFSKDISGEIDDDGAFNFESNYYYSISLVKFGNTVYLKGNLIEDGENTNIKITISPNLMLVFGIYLIIFASLNVLFGDNSVMGHNGKISNFFVLVLMELVFFGFIQINSFLLRRKFEKVMGLME